MVTAAIFSSSVYSFIFFNILLEILCLINVSKYKTQFFKLILFISLLMLILYCWFLHSWRWSSAGPATTITAGDLRLHAPGVFRSRLERPTPHEHVHVQIEGNHFEALSSRAPSPRGPHHPTRLWRFRSCSSLLPEPRYHDDATAISAATTTTTTTTAHVWRWSPATRFWSEVSIV